MNLPESIQGIFSRFLGSETDEVLLYLLVFLFFFITGSWEENAIDGKSSNGVGFPIILVIIFILIFTGDNGFNH